MVIDDLKDLQICNLQYPDQEGLIFTGKWEGWRDHWYQDVAGVWTIGHGHAQAEGDKVDPAEWWSESYGLARLCVDMARCVRPLVPLAQKYPGLRRQNRINALADWLFNCGPGAIGTEANPSHVLEAIMHDAWGDVPAGLRLWCKIVDPKTGAKVTNPGLLGRRNSEAVIFANEPALDDRTLADCGAPLERGNMIAIPDEEIARRGVFPLWELEGDVMDDERRADLERRNQEAGF